MSKIGKLDIPRPEYPRPQMVRNEWLNLNGTWEFEIDHGKSGRERNLYEADSLKNQILVPFCPESKLSGIEYKDFMDAVWYKREFHISNEWLSKRVIVHFGAVDYATEVWINGNSVGTHKGGYSSFSIDITGYIKEGINNIIICAEDDVRSGEQPRGKQSSMYHSHGCEYTRTTGIWQTVWLESVPDLYIKSLKYINDTKQGSLNIEAILNQYSSNTELHAEAIFEGKKVGNIKKKISGNYINLTLKLTEVHYWEPGIPNLYDLNLKLVSNNKTIDNVESYFGMRSISWDNHKMYINGKPVFQRLVLDQGFYPDGIYTAPTEEDLINDIDISMGLGFNGARLHEKIFEPRYLYWADKKGYLVWGEHANWGLHIDTEAGLQRFLPEWIEALERDFNHPSIVGWCPFNETWDIDGRSQKDNILETVYRTTKIIDRTRPVIDTSGNYHVITDIFDIHDYEQDPAKFNDKFKSMTGNGEVYNTHPDRQQYENQPYFVSEFGGIGWKSAEVDGWAWGSLPDSKSEFIDRYRGLVETLLFNPQVCAFCYTQLYDVEQEINGLYTYDRKAKFDPEIFKNINIQRAAIEED